MSPVDALLTSRAWPAFLVASFLLAIVPGPGVVYLVTRTLSQGRRAGFASIGGIALGNLGNAIAASVGLAAVLATSRSMFLIVKLAGAGYLVYLGVRTLLTHGSEAPVAASPPAGAGRLFRDAFLVALLNPKTALFFAALLPQFISAEASLLLQSLVFASVFVLIAIGTDAVYVLSAAWFRGSIRQGAPWLRRGRYLSAGTFFGLGIYAAVSGPSR